MFGCSFLVVIWVNFYVIAEIKTLNCIRFPFNISYIAFENIDLDSIRKMILKDLDGLYNSIEFIIEVWEGKRE